MGKRQSLADWISEAMADDDKDGPCRQLSLVHMSGGHSQREIHTAKIGDDKRNPGSLATMFEGKAHGYAQDLPGVQTFNLMAFYGTNEEPQAFHPIMIAGEQNLPGLSTESPNAEGLAQQAMRHAEVAIKLLCNQTATLFDASLNTLAAVIKQNQMLMEENQEAFQIVKEYALEKTLNTHDLETKRLAFERQTGERKKLLSFAPALINTITGKEVFPQSASDTALLEQIADAIDPNDFAKLGGVVPPELMGPLAARFTQHIEKKNAEQERVRKLAEQARVTSKNPELEAAGEVET